VVGEVAPVIDGSAAATAGLTAAEAAVRLRRDGPNVMPAPRPPSSATLLLRQLTHFFAVLLWVAVGLAAVAGLPQLAVAIAVVILLNGVFAFAQEYRANRAASRLRDLLPVRATVVRDGVRRDVSAADLVVGDVVLLEPGDRVCADLQLLAVEQLQLDESMLTGESTGVRPGVGREASAGTFVIEGEATARVVATGGATRLADIAAMTREAHSPPSPLTVSLDRVVRRIAEIAVTVGVSFFLLALALGMHPRDGFLFGIGVTVALVPEGLLPTVTLSLAFAAQRMAGRHALVRRLDAVETLGSTTFVCTDKTGTMTRNEMAVVAVWTPQGALDVEPSGYEPTPIDLAPSPSADAVRALARSASLASTGLVVRDATGVWRPHGDPMEAALHVFLLRLEGLDGGPVETTRRLPFDARRRRVSAVAAGRLHVKGAVETVLPLCGASAEGARAAAHDLAARGLRVLAVASAVAGAGAATGTADEVERDLTLLGVIGLQDPPREGAAEAVAACRRAGIRLAMVTGDHPMTARSVAAEVGLLGPSEHVVQGSDLPADDVALGALVDEDGIVIARVTPEDKLRIARALQGRGHVVAMTGDGVNDGPALRTADIGVAMGRSGTDVAREAADLVLLDDHLATIVAAVELGRATFANVRRFLTYHLTDNVAELTPFAVWALSGGQIPLAITVLQVLALDIGTDLLPALALGAEPPNPRTLESRPRTDRLVDRPLLARAFGVLGPAESVVSMVAFLVVLLAGGWRFGADADPALLGTASGTAFAAVVLGQMANAFACRSEARWVGALAVSGNQLLLGAVAVEVATLLVFVGWAPMVHLLGGRWPGLLGWALAVLTIPSVVLADAVHKAARARAVRRRLGPPAAPAARPTERSGSRRSG